MQAIIIGILQKLRFQLMHYKQQTNFVLLTEQDYSGSINLTYLVNAVILTVILHRLKDSEETSIEFAHASLSAINANHTVDVPSEHSTRWRPIVTLGVTKYKYF